MNDDIVCLLQDLGKDLAVDVITNYIILNPDTEELIAAKMGAFLSTQEHPSQQPGASDQSTSTASTLLPKSLMSAIFEESHKMVFVVNMDLNMGRGKQCAQVAHAALGLCLKIQEGGNSEAQTKMLQWISMGQKKIVLRGNNLQQIKSIQQEAEKAGLPTLLVTDAGCTQIAPGSKTVLGIFGTNSEVDMITGSLKLL